MNTPDSIAYAGQIAGGVWFSGYRDDGGISTVCALSPITHLEDP